MNAERLLALYDRVADTPDAVVRLRRFVLDLAVRGKLVEQDPGDEPAVKLLERIETEKARLVKAGEIGRGLQAIPRFSEFRSICQKAGRGSPWGQRFFMTRESSGNLGRSTSLFGSLSLKTSRKIRVSL